VQPSKVAASTPDQMAKPAAAANAGNTKRNNLNTRHQAVVTSD